MFNIAMVCDFFYPNFGGVESHIYNLAQCLLRRGHKVIVITHSYGNRTGIRYMANSLKVYYLPVVPFYNESIFVTMVTTLPLLRRIIRHENINIIHSHVAFSVFALEAVFSGSLMGLGIVFTEHSLFGFADASAVFTNSALKMSLSNADNIICVSHTSKENVVLRSGVAQSDVFVIPNAVDNAYFEPDFKRTRPPKKVVVVMGCRMVYRKGIDLIADVIPRICNKVFSNGTTVDFIIAGDGPKRILLEEEIEVSGLQSRVKMLGKVRQSDIRQELLIKGDIFLNTSLTEAFCMAIVEAASCGLLVVSTKVGGIPEVLPEPYIQFVEPEEQSIEDGLSLAVEQVIHNKHPSKEDFFEFVQNAYTWTNVTERTEAVYAQSRLKAGKSLDQRVRNLWETGFLSGPLMAVLYLFCHYYIIIFDFLFN